MELDETVDKVFLEIVPSYMLFYNRRRYDTGYKINLYNCFQLTLTWKKCFHWFVSTKIELIDNYTPTAEDAYILNELSNMVKGDTVVKMIHWFKKQCKLKKLNPNLN